MNSFIWSRIETSGLIRYLGPTDVDLSLTPVTVNQLVFLTDSEFNGIIRIFNVQSHTWRERLGTHIGRDYGHTGTTGLHGSAIILGAYIQPDDKAYNPVITVRIEPKSLQQLAIQMIYQKVEPILWKMLPKKLTCKMEGTV